MRSRVPCLLGGLALLMLTACGNDDGKNPVQPDPARPFPFARPTVATMQMDLEDLQRGSPKAPPRVCHALSAAAVAWVNLNVVVRLAVPVSAFSACLNQPSVYIGDETWRWTASGGIAPQAWTAELTGHDAGEGVEDWSMRISGTARNLDRFLWFNGTCDTAAHAGAWHYYDPAGLPAQTEVIRCDWSLPAIPGEAQVVQFENVGPGHADLGDRLRYEVVSYTASVTYEDANPVASTIVRWDLRNGAGTAISAQGDTCCWGVRPFFPDTVCAH